jgi:predicted esterase
MKFSFLQCLICSVLLAAWDTRHALGQPVEGVRAKKFVLQPVLEYYLIAADGKLQIPQRGYKLLIVMPGGDGSADFLPFVQNFYNNVLNEEYLLIQLIAPKWNEQQVIVWPTLRNKVAGQKASVEQFVKAAVEDVRKRARIDDRHVYTLSWSSGGPAAYAASLTKDTPVTGSFVAMSVFKPNELPGLKRLAKQQRYYILHSPDDEVCPYRMAASARDILREAGAKVEFVEYEGGHGWHGDVFGNIQKGITGWSRKRLRSALLERRRPSIAVARMAEKPQ